MPQVAARINDDQEKWLKDYFRTKSAGAEFILPWAVDIFFRGISSIKQEFTEAELKTIVRIYKDARISPEQTRISYLLLRLNEACERDNIIEMYSASRPSLESKLKKLDDTQITALIIWASAFWVNKSYSAEDLDKYIAS